jgi:alpha-L-fucosidase
MLTKKKERIMKKVIPFFLTFVFIISSISSFAAEYEANWDSLDKRPVADWFEDAKFGIFIHWGPYSVPAWTPKGTYSEWYQYWLQNKTLFGNGNFTGTEVFDYHVKTYGPHFSYYQFGEQFKADLFTPDDWADLFKRAGAKYIVITSKHHDGYCLWPNEQANDRGFAWNSKDVGSNRDLLGELTPAVKKVGIKMGFYYSLYEWFHPWWKSDKEKFVDEHFHPQVKDLVEKYQPDILWGDGEWEMEAEKWKSQELMAWLFNESSVKDTIVINDRWGKGVRHNHGGYYTTEYDATATYNKPWEECRGMGFSFGYNQNEDAEDYNSTQTLILMLADIVSHGGNLLLDIGPDGRGKIPVIMQDRLIQMGKWLAVNGDAIYGTRKWKRSTQWTDGDQNYKPKEQHYLGGDYILKLMVDPEPGYARKEILFTSKKNALYAMAPLWPGETLTIKDYSADANTNVQFLATGQSLEWKNTNGNLVIAMPEFDPNKIKSELQHLYVFEITSN